MFVIHREASRTFQRTFRQALKLRRPLATGAKEPSLFDSLDTFPRRHVGPDKHEANKMLGALGYSSMEDFVKDAIPLHIRANPANVSDKSIPPLSESELLQRAGELSRRNQVYKSYIGMGYHTAVVPPVILRNVSGFIHSLLLLRTRETNIIHDSKTVK